MKLLCTDLDRTLLPNGVQTESENARPILWHLLRSFGLALAYVSGRDLNRVLKAITDYELPVPDYIVADVGASIYIHGNGGWQACSNWQSVLSRQWRGHDSRYISTFLSEFGALKLQESDRQTPFKCSYYYDQTHDEASLRDMILTRLRDEDMSAELIFSHDPEKNLGLLDILPGSANKREPVAYLQNLAELADHDVLFAGDSGNDVAAVLAPHPSVLVANADAHTQREVLLRNSRSTHPESTYLAKGGLEVADHEALNGYYAAGIVEGLVYFRPVWKECLSDSRWVQNALAQKSR